MTGKPFLSEAMRQDLENYGQTHDPQTGALITRADWTLPKAKNPRERAAQREAIRSGWVYHPGTGALTAPEVAAERDTTDMSGVVDELVSAALRRFWGMAE